MSPILKFRRKTWLLSALIIISAVSLWAFYSDSADCGHRPSVLSVPSPLTQSNNVLPNDSPVDEDQDGLDDLQEDRLANRFAPIIHHGQCEPNYPASVDWWLTRTSLHEYDSQANPSQKIFAAQLARQAELLDREFAAIRPDQKIGSDASYSLCKRTTFFLANVGREDQAGECSTPANWITYVHSYPNKMGGVTIQYWRGYSYNAVSVLGVDFSHGGDWEAVAVHLDTAMKPATVALLGHAGIEYRLSDLEWEGEHPRIWSEEGGHASLPSNQGMKSKKFTRQETWDGGQVVWWDGTPAGRSGGLLNVGERSRPRNGQGFIQYSGLWGSPARLFVTSGYWGPAFNETGALCEDGSAAYRPSLTCSADPKRCGRVFHKAWCDGMDEQRLDINVECYASRHSP